jgi:putative DNA primase/helicase
MPDDDDIAQVEDFRPSSAPLIPMTHPDGPRGCSWDGVAIEPDEDGIVWVPLEAVAVLHESQGYVGVPEGSVDDSSGRPRNGEDPNPPGQITIRVYRGLLHKAADEGLAALAKAGVPFYRRDREMVRVCLIKAKASDGEMIYVPGIVPVSQPLLRRALGQSAEWKREKANSEEIRIDPPKDVVEQVSDMIDDWPFPPLAGVIATPTLRRDGSLLNRQGYDEATGFVLMLGDLKVPRIPDQPTRAQAEAQLRVLNELLTGFPFVDNESRSIALSMLITPVLRAALGPVPMHLFVKPSPGTGASYLADVAAMIATGERCAVIAMAPKPDETEKRLVAAALAGFPIISLDNCRGILSGDFLCQVTERPLLQLRPLGGSAMVRMPNSFTVFANGNNPATADDMVRRTLVGTMDANVEHPELREFPNDPLSMVRQNRGRYVAAALTIARAYIVAGKPGRLPPLLSFQPWSDMVRCTLVWLNQADPVQTMAAARAEDPIRQQKDAVFTAWAAELSLGEPGYQTAELIRLAQERFTHECSNPGELIRPSLRAALLAVAGKGASEPSIDANRLGYWLRDATNNITGGHKLTKSARETTRPRWVLNAI